MTRRNLNEAIAEAERFLVRAKAAEAATAALKHEWDIGGPECAAAKRASLDLTKALAKMRRAR